MHSDFLGARQQAICGDAVQPSFESRSAYQIAKRFAVNCLALERAFGRLHHSAHLFDRVRARFGDSL